VFLDLTRFISAEHIAQRDGQWHIDPEVPYDPSWHGASVISNRDGKLMGMLLLGDDGATIAGFKTP